mgnify:FL=1
MGILLLLRHGESGANQQGIFTGQLDYDLTALGYAQARCAARFILANYQVDALYASSLQRAVHTAQPLSSALKLPITLTPAFREINAGSWQGRRFTELAARDAAAYDVWRHDIGRCVCPQGESVAQVAACVLSAFQSLAEKHAAETIVIATHATPIRALICVLSGHALSDMQRVPWTRNASLTEIHYTDGTFTLGRISVDDYLAGMETALPQEA